MTKIKWIIAAGIGVVVAGAVLLAYVLTRTREHAATAAKVAAGSGAIAAAAGPALIADKAYLSHHVQTLSQVDASEVRRLADEVASAHEAEGDRGVAALLNAQLETQSEARETLARWLALRWPEDEDEQPLRESALHAVTETYPPREPRDPDELDILSAVNMALWDAEQWEDGNRYADVVLPAMQDALADGESAAIEWMGRYLEQVTAMPREVEGREQLLAQMDDLAPAATLDMTQAPHRIVAQHVIRQCIDSGRVREAVAYYDAVAQQLSEVPEHERDVILAAINLPDAVEPDDLRMFEEFYAISVEHVPPADLNRWWTANTEGLPLEMRRESYRRLLTAHGETALPIAEENLASTARNVAAEELVDDHLELIAYELEAGQRSPTLVTLLDELEARNAHEQVDALVTFLWRTFPTERVGVQAFDHWIRSDASDDRQALRQRAVAEILSSYPDQPIAEAARMASLWFQAREGRTLEAMLEWEQTTAEKPASHNVLSLSMLNELKDGFRRDMEEAGFPVDDSTLSIQVADQLLQVGEAPLAAALYWQVARASRATSVDPRTGQPFAPPSIGRQVSGEEAAVTADFWRAMALLTSGENEKAIEVLERLDGRESGGELLEVARLLLAAELVDAERHQDAWEVYRSLPRELVHTDAGEEIYGALAATLPAEDLYSERALRIDELTEALGDDLRGEEAARAHMTVAGLLVENEHQLDAVRHYEQVIDQHADSELVPEAIYRAVTIYRALGEQQRARRLTELLQSEHPDSSYLERISQ